MFECMFDGSSKHRPTDTVKLPMGSGQRAAGMSGAPSGPPGRARHPSGTHARALPATQPARMPLRLFPQYVKVGAPETLFGMGLGHDLRCKEWESTRFTDGFTEGQLLSTRGTVRTPTMKQLTRRLTVIAGGAAVIGMISFTAACGTEEEAPETTTPTTTTTTTTTSPAETPAPPPPVEPTEKSINPTGGNLFTPSVRAPGPQTAVPGNRENTG